MSSPGLGAVGASPSPATFNDEPLESTAPAPEPLLCVDPASGGSEGARGGGADALVRRFANGTGGVPSAEPARDDSSASAPSCLDEALATTASCGSLAAGIVTGPAALVAGAMCISNVMSLAECLDQQSRANQRAGRE